MNRTARLLCLLLLLPAAAGYSQEQADKPGSVPTPADLPEIRKLIDEGHHAEAEERARSAWDRLEREHGPASVEVSLALDLLVECLRLTGKVGTPEARELAEHAVAIKQERLGEEHPELARSLGVLGRVLEGTGQRAEAVSTYGRAIAILEASPPEYWPELVRVLILLANSHLRAADYEPAKNRFEQALAVHGRLADPDRKTQALILNNLGILNYETGRYAASRSLFEEALALKESIAPDSADVAWTLNGLAVLLEEISDDAAAESLHRRALAIRERIHGHEDVRTGGSRNNLANLLVRKGDYLEGKALLEANREIIEKKFRGDHPEMIPTLSGLAQLHEMMGDHARARDLYERVLAIRREEGDEVEVATTLVRLAAVRVRLQEYAAAGVLYEKALEIYRRRLGTQHSNYAWALDGLADLRETTGNLPEARRLYEQSLSIRREILGEQHHEVAESLGHLGHLLAAAGDLASALPLLEHSRATFETSLGQDHPALAELLDNLGQVLARTGRDKEALESSLRSEQIGREHLRRVATGLSERLALVYASARPSGLDLALSQCARGLGPEQERRVWDALIHSRALVLDEMATRRRVLSGVSEPEIVKLANAASEASRRLATLAARGPGEHHPELYLDLMRQTLEEKERAEQELGRRSLSFRQAQALRQVGLQEVVQALSVRAALVAFAVHSPAPLRATSDRGDLPGMPIHAVKGGASSYLAFVLRHGLIDPVVVPLGDRSEIDGVVRQWAAQVSRPPSGREPGKSERASREAGEKLRRLVWDPLLPGIQGAEIVFVVPDGGLNLINFAALPAESSRYLVETGPTIHYLSAERDLVPLRATERRGHGLLALGAPSYDQRSLFATLAPRPGPQPAVEPAAARAFRSACADLANVHFAPLPASSLETAEITALWKRSKVRVDSGPRDDDAVVIHLTGAEATEGAFKRHAAAARVVHLATHGFFLGSSCLSQPDATRGIGGLSPLQSVPREALPGETPLLLSGLALAGANHRMAASREEEDGILTAAEIATMDLQGVEWAVLSACDTGRGEIKAGEGVLGLRRAFQVAGVDTVIMSLWSVEDESAREWMRALYELRLLGRLGAAEAVRRATLQLLERRRRDGETTHPFHWAAWVAAGSSN